jgi:hypothetical protein
MEACGDNAAMAGRGAAATVSAGAGDFSAGVEQDVSARLTARAERKRMHVLEWFIE